MKVNAFFIILCFIISLPVSAQKATTGVKSGPYTLQQQFNSMKYRSSSYKEFNHDYKVVRVSTLDAFWTHVQDSLKAREQNIRKAGKATAASLVQAQKTVAEQKNQIQTLTKENAQKELQLQKNVHDVESLSVLGLDMNKQVYVILSGVIFIGLLVLAGVFAYLYQKSKAITDEKIRAYDDISKEFKDHKQQARERETKIKRDLQTETNKIDELNQQLAQLKKQVSL